MSENDLLLKSYYGNESGKASLVFAMCEDREDDIHIPETDYVTERDLMVCVKGSSDNSDHLTLNRQQCMDLALFLAKCASLMEGE